MSTAITATSADPRELYDVIIIGGSYAGLSAALTLYRATHTCLIVDTGSPRNQAAMNMRLTPGWEGQNPRKMRDAARAELHESGLVKFVSEAVRRVEKTSEGQFEVIDAGAGTWKARKILLAVGVEEIYPDIEGYADNYGRSIYYCMFCFGYEQRGSPSAGVLAIGTLAHPDHAITNARDASKFAEVTTIYTDGNSALQSQLLSKVNGGIQVNNERIRRLVQPKSGGGIVIEFHSGDKRNLSFLVHKPDLEVERSLPDQLGVECVPGFGIKVTPPFNKTNIAGVYAAGDCCSPLRNIPNAQSMGSFAGCGLARELPRRL